MHRLLTSTARGARRPVRRAATLVATVLAVAALAACGGGGSHPGGSAYVALGDSESAGAGISPIADAGCLRSRRNYPNLVQKELHYASFADTTCSGAMTTDLLRPQFANGTTNDPQLDAVGSGTRLVTLTIGLNDDKLAFALLAACLSTDGKPSAVCQQVLGVSQSQLDHQLSVAARRVQDSLLLIRNKAPKARIILVGYPRYLPDSGTCPDRFPMLDQMVPRLRSSFATVNRDWRRAAKAAGADYIDTYAMSKGHDVCSADPWVNGATDDPGRAVRLHPFEAFHAAVAEAIVKLVKP